MLDEELTESELNLLIEDTKRFGKEIDDAIDNHELCPGCYVALLHSTCLCEKGEQ